MPTRIVARLTSRLLCVWMSILTLPSPAHGLTVDDLAPGAELVVRKIYLAGNDAYSDASLKAKLSTRERPWYTPWRPRPAFDPYAFRDDLDRLHRFYRSEGYYRMKADYDLTVEGDLVTVELRLDENGRTRVETVAVGVSGEGGESEPLPEKLPLAAGDPFTESDYQASENRLKEFFLNHSFPSVEVERLATVDPQRERAEIRYIVRPGHLGEFGDTRIEGTLDVDPSLVVRELEYSRGEPFSLTEIERSRANLLGLQLFRSVKIGWKQNDRDPASADMVVRVAEKPPREIRIGAGYGTKDEFRVQVGWQHYNWLGGGRQLSMGLKYSTVTSSAEAKFVQPHFLTRRTRGILEFAQDVENEDTFSLLATRFQPGLEHSFTRSLDGWLGYRVELADLSDIDDATDAALGGVRRRGVLSGPALGLRWTTTDDALDPKTGESISIALDQPGELWGGSFRYYRLTGEAAKYLAVGASTILAGRLKVGLADTLGTARDFPIFDRFYAGGERSVRGYGRRRLGPLSSTNRPLGGLSLIEGSVEARRPIRGDLGGVVFVDFGQVRLGAFDLPIGDLRFSAGPGLTYRTPIGPLSLFVGFPFQPPRGDAAWQLHFSIGQFF